MYMCVSVSARMCTADCVLLAGVTASGSIAEGYGEAWRVRAEMCRVSRHACIVAVMDNKTIVQHLTPAVSPELFLWCCSSCLPMPKAAVRTALWCCIPCLPMPQAKVRTAQLVGG
eukprot:1141127-Pelagomonas_calceolata.AAC.3